MTEHEATPDADRNDEPAVDSEQAGMADAVDDRAAALTGSQGAAETAAPVADNSGAVAHAEEHLDDTNLDSDREMLKKLQQGM